MSTAASRRSGGPGSAGIDLDQVVRTAVTLGERHGFDELSMRRLAAELGVGAMTLYSYVPTKQALLELIADRYLQELELDRTTGNWLDDVVAIFRSLRAVTLKHPALGQAMISQPIETLGAYRLAEAVLHLLNQAGFPERVAVDVFRRLASFTIGFALHQLVRQAEAAPTQEQRLARLHQLPPEQFPHVLAAAEHWGDWNSEELFDEGLMLLLGQSSLAPPARPRPAGDGDRQ